MHLTLTPLPTTQSDASTLINALMAHEMPFYAAEAIAHKLTTILDLGQVQALIDAFEGSSGELEQARDKLETYKCQIEELEKNALELEEKVGSLNAELERIRNAVKTLAGTQGGK